MTSFKQIPTNNDPYKGSTQDAYVNPRFVTAFTGDDQRGRCTVWVVGNEGYGTARIDATIGPSEVKRILEEDAGFCDCGRELSPGLCSVCDNDE